MKNHLALEVLTLILIKGGYDSTEYSQQTANTTFIQATGPTTIEGIERFSDISDDKYEVSR